MNEKQKDKYTHYLIAIILTFIAIVAFFISVAIAIAVIRFLMGGG